MSGALAGRRVVVTRPGGADDAVARRLRALGAVVLAAPAIAFAPATPAEAAALDAALARLGDGDWLACASANAVAAVADRAPLRRAIAAGARVAAVGEATAAACRAAGLAVAVVGDDGTAAGLAAALVRTAARRDPAAAAPSRPPHAVLPGADIARPDLAAQLRAAGWTVEAVVAYHTARRPPPPAVAAAIADGVDAVVFASPSAVDGLAGGLDSAGRRGLARAAVVCIGPTTAAAAAAAGLPVAAVASAQSAAALVDAVQGAVAAHRTGGSP